MTLIATDGRTMAADGLEATAGGIITTKDCKKIIRRGGRIYGFMGLSAMVEPIVDWIDKGADPDKRPKANSEDDNDYGVLVAGADGIFYYCDTTPYRETCEPPYAIGVNASGAMMAIKLGYPPVEAVRLACEDTVWAGGQVTVEDVPQPKTIEQEVFEETGGDIHRLVPRQCDASTKTTPVTKTLSVSAGSKAAGRDDDLVLEKSDVEYFFKKISALLEADNEERHQRSGSLLKK